MKWAIQRVAGTQPCLTLSWCSLPVITLRSSVTGNTQAHICPMSPYKMTIAGLQNAPTSNASLNKQAWHLLVTPGELCPGLLPSLEQARLSSPLGAQPLVPPDSSHSSLAALGF